MSRLPIFRDDHSFHEQTERMFREMEEKMGFRDPFNPGANAPLPDLMSGGAHWPPMGFDDSMFFQLRPSASISHQVSPCALLLLFTVLNTLETMSTTSDVENNKTSVSCIHM